MDEWDRFKHLKDRRLQRKKIDRKALFPRLFNRILVNIIFFIGNQERKIDVFINYILG